MYHAMPLSSIDGGSIVSGWFGSPPTILSGSWPGLAALSEWKPLQERLKLACKRRGEKKTLRVGRIEW